MVSSPRLLAVKLDSVGDIGQGAAVALGVQVGQATFPIVDGIGGVQLSGKYVKGYRSTNNWCPCHLFSGLKPVHLAVPWLWSRKTIDQTCENRREELCLITLFIAHSQKWGVGCPLHHGKGCKEQPRAPGEEGGGR